MSFRRSVADHWPEMLACLLFVISRVGIWQWSAKYPEDVNRYADWAIEQQEARREGKDIYSFHLEKVRAELKQRKEKGLTGGEEYEAIEYPPLSLDVLLLPTRLLGPLPTDPDGTLAWRDRYVALYRVQFVVCDVGTFLLLLWLIARLFAGETPWQRAERLLVYLGASTALGFVLFNRLDAGLALLVALASCLFIARVHFIWSFLVLGLAVHFKLIPLVLAPVWILGTMPALASGLPRRWTTLARPLLLRCGLLFVILGGIMLPYYLVAGPRSLAYLGYHRDRGIEVESIYANAVALLNEPGASLDVHESYGSYNIRSEGSPALAMLATLAALGLLGSLALVLLYRLLGRMGSEPGPTLAQTHPHYFLGWAFLFLLASIATSKVFSPQYLIWLLPLGVLLPFQEPWRRLALALLGATCVLTGIIYPFLFWEHVVGTSVTPEGLEICRGYSAKGLLVVTLRNALTLALLLLTAWRLMRRDAPADYSRSIRSSLG